MKIYYGISNNHLIDVTDICLLKLTKNNIINIPKDDNSRAKYFTDPFYGILKKIIIIDSDNKITEYEQGTQIKIDLLNNTMANNNNKSDTESEEEDNVQVNTDLPNEQWLPIPDEPFNKTFAVSNMGRIHFPKIERNTH